MAPTTRSENAMQLQAMLDGAFAENDRLRREDPAAFAAKIQASLPSMHCAMCRVQFNGYGNNAQRVHLLTSLGFSRLCLTPLSTLNTSQTPRSCPRRFFFHKPGPHSTLTV